MPQAHNSLITNSNTSTVTQQAPAQPETPTTAQQTPATTFTSSNYISRTSIQSLMLGPSISAPMQREVSTSAQTPTRKMCNCKNSRCLKLYCECFASGEYCKNCNCSNCHNNLENETVRKETISAILERNSNAFRPKIAASNKAA